MKREEKNRLNRFIASNLNKILNSRGISQRDLAKMVGKSETSISRWLTGHNGFSQDTIEMLNKVLDIDITKAIISLGAPQDYERVAQPNGTSSFVSVKKLKTALITGVTGQDGSFLAEFLLNKGYDVHGIIRRSSVDYRERIAHLEGVDNFHLHYADMGDSMSIVKVVDRVRPDEIYNLAAQSHVQVSFDAPEFTANVDAIGVLRILEAVRACHLENCCKIYQASTSELYGKVQQVPQNENTPFHPYSPYAVAKLYGFWIVKEYREAYGMYCCSGILFNHESERRGETFVTRKITLAAARIAQGLQDVLYLGNLSSLRDWGYAKDYV